MKLCRRVATTVALGSFLAMHATVAPFALEVTAVGQPDHAVTDLGASMKISAFSAAVEAAINVLSAKINAFDAKLNDLVSRVTALENKTSSGAVSTYALNANSSANIGVHTFCALNYTVGWDKKGSYSCNCSVQKSGSSWVLSASIPVRATQCTCGASCLD